MKKIIESLTPAITNLHLEKNEQLSEQYKTTILPHVEVAKSLASVIIGKKEIIEIISGAQEGIKCITGSIIKSHAILQLIQLEGVNNVDESFMIITPEGPMDMTGEAVEKLKESLQRQREAKLRLEKKEQMFAAILTVIETSEMLSATSA